jgi:hypothetical protein
MNQRQNHIAAVQNDILNLRHQEFKAVEDIHAEVDRIFDQLNLSKSALNAEINNSKSQDLPMSILHQEFELDNLKPYLANALALKNTERLNSIIALLDELNIAITNPTKQNDLHLKIGAMLINFGDTPPAVIVKIKVDPKLENFKLIDQYERHYIKKTEKSLRNNWRTAQVNEWRNKLNKIDDDLGEIKNLKNEIDAIFILTQYDKQDMDDIENKKIDSNRVAEFYKKEYPKYNENVKEKCNNFIKVGYSPTYQTTLFNIAKSQNPQKSTGSGLTWWERARQTWKNASLIEKAALVVGGILAVSLLVIGGGMLLAGGTIATLGALPIAIGIGGMVTAGYMSSHQIEQANTPLIYPSTSPSSTTSSSSAIFETLEVKTDHLSKDAMNEEKYSPGPSPSSSLRAPVASTHISSDFTVATGGLFGKSSLHKVPEEKSPPTEISHLPKKS